MNTVWKDLDPIFRRTLREFVVETNRQCFDLYATAVGFRKEHTGLLYLTLYLEKQQCDDENSDNKKRSFSEVDDGKNEGNYHQISVGDDRGGMEPSSKRRKISKEPVIKQVINSELEKDHRSNDRLRNLLPYKKRMKNQNSISIPSPLPVHNAFNNTMRQDPLFSNKIYEDLINKTNLKNYPKHDELRKYEKLKHCSHSFKNQKMPSRIVQNNKRRINAMIKHCDAYRESLGRNQTMTATRTTILRYHAEDTIYARDRNPIVAFQKPPRLEDSFDIVHNI